MQRNIPEIPKIVRQMIMPMKENKALIFTLEPY